MIERIDSNGLNKEDRLELAHGMLSEECTRTPLDLAFRRASQRFHVKKVDLMTYAITHGSERGRKLSRIIYHVWCKTGKKPNVGIPDFW